MAPQHCLLAVMCWSVCSFTFTAWIMSSGNCRNALPSSLLRSVVSKRETGLIWCQLLSPVKHWYLQRWEQIACSHLGTSSLQFMLAEEFVNLTRTKVRGAFWNPYSLLPEFHFGHFGLGAKRKSSASVSWGNTHALPLSPGLVMKHTMAPPLSFISMGKPSA